MFFISRCLLYQLWGFQTKVYKLVAVIVYARLKMKSWFFAKTQWIVYLWGLSVFIYAKTVGSLFHLYGCGKPPQPYRWCFFGCRYSGCSWWCCRSVLEILWLKLTALVVSGGPRVVHCLIGSVYGLCHLCHLLHKPFLLCIYIKEKLKQIDVKCKSGHNPHTHPAPP